MLVDEGMLLKALRVAANMKALWTVSITFASPQIVTEANWFAIWVGGDTTSQSCWHWALAGFARPLS